MRRPSSVRSGCSRRSACPPPPRASIPTPCWTRCGGTRSRATGACPSCWRRPSEPSRSSPTCRRPRCGRPWRRSRGSALTIETGAPYNGSAMTVDDPAIAGAIRRHEERLQRDPESLAFAQLADLYRKSGRAQDAIALCRRGLDRYPHYTTARLILAKTLLGEGHHDAALAELVAIIQESPKEAQAHRLAAEVHRLRGSLDAAVEHLDAAARLDPTDRESRALLGLLRAAPREGESSGLGRVLADDTFVTTSFGTLCLDQGLTEEALNIFIRILRKEPDNADARAGLEGALRARLKRKG